MGFTKSVASYKTVQLNEGYIALLQSLIHLQSRESQTVRLLDQNMDYYQKVNTVLNHLGTSDFKPNMKVRVPYFPLDCLQNKTLDKIVSEYKDASKMSSTILENS